MERIEIDSQVIYHGHVIEVLNSLPARSVHCCLTSPPFFSQRLYSTEPQIWGGNPRCNHEFFPAGTRHKGGPGGGGAANKGRSAVAARNVAQHVTCGEVCPHCNAWRGELGMEPEPQLFIAHLVETFDAL